MKYKNFNYLTVVVPNPVGPGMVEMVDQVQGYTRHDEHPVWATGYDADGNLTSRKEVPELVMRAFLNGSMFGWDCDGSDPNFLENGIGQLSIRRVH